jgi:D-methionine transport system substrate-binding protein
MKKSIIVGLVVVVLAAIGFIFFGDKEDTKLVVAASSTPHAEILEYVEDILDEKGIDLEIRVMDDYIIPNTATEDGEVDANYFQHLPYLNDFNKERGTHLVSVAAVHYEPYAIYAGTVKSFDGLKNGDSIAVPNDPTNEARALMLLEANGLIKLAEGKGLSATPADIVENKLNLKIREMEAALITGVLDEVALAVINGNYAIPAGLEVKDALAVEDAESEAATTFANILVVKEGNENNEDIKVLAEVLNSKEVKEFIENKYNGAVLPTK